MKASDYIANFLTEQGVRCVFEVSGGMITHLLDSMHRLGNLRVVSVHHEQAAAFAVDAVGRMTGVPGVAMATSGPGATNLLTGIASCFFDSSPGVFLTGQVNRSEQKGDRKIRQLGFQEADIVAMATPITKAAWKLRTIDELPCLMKKAFEVATTGRPGPVLLDLPMDLQRAQLPDDSNTSEPKEVAETLQPDPAKVSAALQLLQRAVRPLVLIGGGIREARVADLLRQFVDLIGVPVVHSLMAVDVLPYAHKLRVGMIGTYGNRWANTAIGNCDCLLVLGSRLDVRQTGSDTEAFRSGRNIIHIDCEPGEINNRITGCDAIVSTLPEFLELANRLALNLQARERPEWHEQIEAWKLQWPDIAELSGIGGVNPNAFLHQLSRASGQARAYVVDVGQHQMWAAQSIELGGNQRFLTSGGLGSMGFALPAAIGVAVSTSDPVVVVAGDGGFQCNIQELQTVVRNKLPIKIVILNNRCHGMVRQFQESYFGGRYQSTLWGYDAPDFERIAVGYGIAGRTLSDPAGGAASAQWLWEDRLNPPYSRSWWTRTPMRIPRSRSDARSRKWNPSQIQPRWRVIDG